MTTELQGFNAHSPTNARHFSLLASVKRLKTHKPSTRRLLMERYIRYFPTLILIFSLAACNRETGQIIPNDWITSPPSNEEITPVPTPTPTDSPSPTTTPIGKVYTGPDEVEKYVMKFVDDAKSQGVDVLPDMKNPTLEIQIGTLDAYGTSVIGLCETYANMRRVTFDPDFWNNVSETQRELLAHHELGHCVLYRGHRSDLLSTGAYASIMYPIIMSSSTYTGNYDYYQQELFTWQTLQQFATTNMNTTHICTHDQL